MLRTFLASSRRLLVPGTLPGLNRSMPQILTPGPTSIYDVRRNINEKNYHHPLLPMESSPLLRRGSLVMMGSRGVVSGTEFKMPGPTELACNLINMVKCVDLNDLKDAPPPTFWTVVVYGVSQLAVPFLQIIGGYSPVLTLYQLYSAAVTLAFNGGMRWGTAMSKDPILSPVWENMTLALIPPGIAITGLLLPYPLGFLTIASGMIVSLYIDLKSCTYAPCYNAINLAKTITSVIGLLFGLSAYILFHNREKDKKMVKAKDQEYYEDEEGAEEDNGKKPVST